jgi:hypothetical protein
MAAHTSPATPSSTTRFAAASEAPSSTPCAATTGRSSNPNTLCDPGACANTPAIGLHSLPGGVRLVTCATRTRLMGCTLTPGAVSDWSHGEHTLVVTPGCHQIGYMENIPAVHGTYRLYMEHTGCHRLNVFLLQNNAVKGANPTPRCPPAPAGRSRRGPGWTAARTAPRGRRYKLHVKEQKFVPGFSRWVKGQAQGLALGGFKLWVNCVPTCTAPTARSARLTISGPRSAAAARTSA